MTLPTFENRYGEIEGRMRLYGGRELLAEMEFLNLSAKVIIVTQFDRFGEPPNTIELPSLLKQLSQAYPELIIGGVYYSNVNSRWRQELRDMLMKVRTLK
jgi:hypothetical protein